MITTTFAKPSISMATPHISNHVVTKNKNANSFQLIALVDGLWNALILG